MISVYSSNEKSFSSNGIKILKPLKALIFKQDNGEYYLDLKDSIDNIISRGTKFVFIYNQIQSSFKLFLQDTLNFVKTLMYFCDNLKISYLRS